jgi:phage N-6-adenine-methyltransferase
MTNEHKSNTPAEIKDAWQTPDALYQSLNNEFNFDCDVAASDENGLCENIIDESMDALTQDQWGVSNWCNPPYSNIKPWVEKAINEHSSGSTIVMLVPADTSVKWFKLAFESCNEVRFISGRISFINAETQKPVNGNNKGSVLFIWRAHSPKQSHCVTLVDRDELMGNK